MEVLGHSTIALTMTTYSHVIPALEREAMNRMNAILTGCLYREPIIPLSSSNPSGLPGHLRRSSSSPSLRRT